MEKNDKNTLLKNFIAEFLSRSNYRGKCRDNEFSNVYYILKKIFNRKLRIKITPEELAYCLSEAGYQFYVRDKKYVSTKNAPKPEGRPVTSEDDFFNAIDEFRLFVNINTKDIRYLKRSMRSISFQKNPNEIIRLRSLKRKITIFFNGIFSSEGYMKPCHSVK